LVHVIHNMFGHNMLEQLIEKLFGAKRDLISMPFGAVFYFLQPGSPGLQRLSRGLKPVRVMW